MKQLLILTSCFIVLAFSSCKKDNEGILVKFVNATGQEILEAKANDQLIGALPGNSSTGYIQFSSFGSDTGMPDIRFTGKMGEIVLESTSRFYWCGTEKSALPPGEYIVEIKTVLVNGTSYFDLRFQ